jgi:16S rRNA (cytosine967-C5)-methyltransferase
VKQGGRMVYATCSLFPSENELQVRRFLTENASFRLVEEKWLTPGRDGTDGFYMALIERTHPE